MSRSVRKKKGRSARARPSAGHGRSAAVSVALLWLVSLLGAGYGLHRLDPYVRRNNRVPTRIEWSGVPQWLTEPYWKHILARLENRVALDPLTDPYDAHVCEYVGRRLAGSAWVERVRRVSVQADGRVVVSAEFRKPFAMIERNGVAYLVDSAGVRLPMGFRSRSVNREGWLVIEGVAARPPEPGQRWIGRDAAGGLRLARFLVNAEESGNLTFRKEIVAIDVSNFDGRRDRRAGDLQIVVRNPQCLIHWGLAPGEEGGVEASPQRKLAMLNALYAARGGFPDRPIDVRSADAILLGNRADTAVRATGGGKRF